jgi:endonuclease/exonuclease/phosphatase family metal-dependent hydrolase
VRRTLAAAAALLALAACRRAESPANAAAGSGPPSAPETIKVASYNAAVLGPTKSSRPGTMGALGAIVARFDLVALQEVGSNDSSASEETCREALSVLVARAVEASGGAPYACLSGGQYAFVYRTDRLEAESLPAPPSGGSLRYPPIAARFRALGRPLDFVMITAHARPALAAVEIPALVRAMDEAAAAQGEPDVLCAGDFNADGDYYEEGEGPALAGFPAERFATVVPNDADTTVASASLAYDRIELTSAMGKDWTGNWGVLRPAQVLDLSACEGTKATAGTERALSDHYPVWVELSTSADSD